MFFPFPSQVHLNPLKLSTDLSAPRLRTSTSSPTVLSSPPPSTISTSSLPSSSMVHLSPLPLAAFISDFFPSACPSLPPLTSESHTSPSSPRFSHPLPPFTTSLPSSAPRRPPLDFILQSLLVNSRSADAVFNSLESIKSRPLSHVRSSGRILAIGPILPATAGFGCRGDEDLLRSSVFFRSQFTAPKAVPAALVRSTVRFVWVAMAEGASSSMDMRQLMKLLNA